MKGTNLEFTAITSYLKQRIFSLFRPVGYEEDRVADFKAVEIAILFIASHARF